MIGAVTALYLNVFVLIAQLFQKVPALKPLAPTQSEPPFLLTQLVLLALFVMLAIAGVIRFRADLSALKGSYGGCHQSGAVVQPPRIK